VEIHILQGERAQASQNRPLGKFHLEGIAAAPRGMPKVEVTFDIDANGILHVTAKDTATGKDQKITITASSGLSEDEVDKMVKDAEAHEAEDKKRREEVERRNKLDNLCYTLEKQISENKDKMDAGDVSALEGLIKEGREPIEKQDDEKVQSVSEELEKKAHELASKLYEGAGGDGAAGADSSGAGAADTKNDDVIDAEFEESK